MAAVLPFLETEEFHFPEELATSGLSGLGAKKSLTAQQEIAKSNTELTNLLWLRAAMHNALAGNSFTLVMMGGEIKIRLAKPFPKYGVPWFGLSSDTQNIRLFSTNGKMRCPTFDLPAGAPTVGGTCPGATPAQTISLGARGQYDASTGTVTPDSFAGKGGILTKRSDGTYGLRMVPGVTYDLARSVCNTCYATGGKYQGSVVQLTEVVHFSLADAASRNAAMGNAFVEAMVWQIPQLDYAGLLEKGVNETAEQTQDRIARLGYPNVVRVHSSGDFFSREYAELWLRIARKLYKQHGRKYQLWAPTRTHVLPEWAGWWAKQDVPPNFTIRPSAYGIGDPAPAAHGLAAGTSVLTEAQTPMGAGIAYDHQCGVYALGKGEKSCVDAMSPDNKRGCRACWVRPDLRVNYTAH